MKQRIRQMSGVLLACAMVLSQLPVSGLAAGREASGGVRTGAEYGGAHTAYAAANTAQDEAVILVNGEKENQLVRVYGAKEQQLSLSIRRGGQDQKMPGPVIWKSDNEKAAAVSSKGVVSFVGAGRAMISATTITGQETATLTVIVQPKPILEKDFSLHIEPRAYDGTTSVQVQTQWKNNVIVQGDDVVFQAVGRMQDADVGENKPVQITYRMTGTDNGNYSLPHSSTGTVTISKAESLPAVGQLTVTNHLAKTYFFDLAALCPKLPQGQTLGTPVEYRLGTPSFANGQPAYENRLSLSMTGSVLQMDVRETAGTAGRICRIPVTITSRNFQDIQAFLLVDGEEADQGRSAVDLTVRNVLRGNDVNPEEEFTYTLALTKQTRDGAAPLDTPVAYRGTGTVAEGSQGVVLPRGGMISFTLKGGQELTFSGSLGQEDSLGYTLTQTARPGYTAAVSRAGEEHGTPQPVEGAVTGSLGYAGRDGAAAHRWAEVVYTNTKDIGTYTITYKANGGEGKERTFFYKANRVAAVVSNQWFRRANYIFVGWNTAADGSGRAYAPGDAAAAGRNVELYAQWRYTGGTSARTDYTLNYAVRGGSPLPNETGSAQWTKSGKDLPTPVREGYTFGGWYLDSRLTRPVTGDVKVDRETVTLYAKWNDKEERVSDRTGVSRWLETVRHDAFLRGYPDHTFGPDRNMTRAEVAQVFYALLRSKPAAGTASFSDVPGDAWYAKAVNALAGLGMLGGYPDGTFCPKDSITRAEFAAVALAFSRVPAGAVCSYPDVSRDDWYYSYAARATACRWMGGYPDGTFRPNDPITRSEVCVIVNNMLGRSGDKNFVDRNRGKLADFADLSAGHWAYYAIMEAVTPHSYTGGEAVEFWKG